MAQAGFTLTRDLLRVSKCPQTSPLDIRALAAKGSTTISRLLCLALPRHQLTGAVDIAGCRTRQASLLHTDERLMSVTLHKRNELR